MTADQDLSGTRTVGDEGRGHSIMGAGELCGTGTGSVACLWLGTSVIESLLLGEMTEVTGDSEANRVLSCLVRWQGTGVFEHWDGNRRR